MSELRDLERRLGTCPRDEFGKVPWTGGLAAGASRGPRHLWTPSARETRDPSLEGAWTRRRGWRWIRSPGPGNRSGPRERGPLGGAGHQSGWRSRQAARASTSWRVL